MRQEEKEGIFFANVFWLVCRPYTTRMQNRDMLSQSAISPTPLFFGRFLNIYSLFPGHDFTKYCHFWDEYFSWESECWFVSAPLLRRWGD